MDAFTNDECTMPQPANLVLVMAAWSNNTVSNVRFSREQSRKVVNVQSEIASAACYPSMRMVS